jgi:hypothetical protein
MISKLCFSVYCILICTCTCRYGWILIFLSTENYNYSRLSESLINIQSLLIIKKNESEVVSFSVHCLMTCYVYNSSHNCMGNNIAVVLLVLVKCTCTCRYGWILIFLSTENYNYSRLSESLINIQSLNSSHLSVFDHLT